MIPSSHLALSCRSLACRLAVAFTALLACNPAAAYTLAFPPETVTTTERIERVGSYALAIGPWREGSIPVQQVEGPIRSTAYRLPILGASTLEILAPLRDQLVAAGFRVLFECAATTCGGFDFRYGTEILPEPEMHVDLGDFWFLSADRGDEYVSLLVSRSSINGFVQVTAIGGDAATAPKAAAAEPSALAAAGSADPANGDSSAPQTEPAAPAFPSALDPGSESLADRLPRLGAVALDDLTFTPGSAELAEGEYASLAALTAFLAADPARRVALVGHTDMSGALEANIALSRRRAQSVADRLKAMGVARSQLDAQGVGYLAPRQSNQTEAGRAMNRRVEVVLLAGP